MQRDQDSIPPGLLELAAAFDAKGDGGSGLFLRRAQ
jgi:hypothetical protein